MRDPATLKKGNTNGLLPVRGMHPSEVSPDILKIWPLYSLEFEDLAKGPPNPKGTTGGVQGQVPSLTTEPREA